MHVAEWMSQPVISICPQDSLQEAAARMRQHRIRHLPVLQQGRLVGMLSERDVQSALPSPATTLSLGEVRFYLTRIRVADVMTRQVVVLSPTTSLAEAARLIRHKKLGALPVLAGQDVVGIVTTTDLLEFLSALLKDEETRQGAYAGRA
ncbi:MAG: CBS domain-containing protein [Candidatus Tectimicrobiota bacterium]